MPTAYKFNVKANQAAFHVVPSGCHARLILLYGLLALDVLREYRSNFHVVWKKFVKELNQVDEVRKLTLARACQAASHIAENTSFSFKERFRGCLSGIDDLKSWGPPPTQVSPRALLDGSNVPISSIVTLNGDGVNESVEDAAEEVIRDCEGVLIFDEGLTRANERVTRADKNVTSAGAEPENIIERMEYVEANVERADAKAGRVDTAVQHTDVKSEKTIERRERADAIAERVEVKSERADGNLKNTVEASSSRNPDRDTYVVSGNLDAELFEDQFLVNLVSRIKLSREERPPWDA